MSRIILFLLLLLSPATTQTLIKLPKEELTNFLIRCPTKCCSPNSPPIRYPFRLPSSPPACGGSPKLLLSCAGNHTLLPISSLPILVTDIDYSLATLTLTLPLPHWTTCLLQNMSLFDLSNTAFSMHTLGFKFFNCSDRINITEEQASQIAGPISCFSGAAYFLYGFVGAASMDIVPKDCVRVMGDREMPLAPGVFEVGNFTEAFDLFVERRVAVVTWGSTGVADECADCESGGGSCGFSEARNQSFCYLKPRMIISFYCFCNSVLFVLN